MTHYPVIVLIPLEPINIYDLLNDVIMIYIQLLAIIDPFLTLPILSQYTSGMDEEQVDRLVKRVSIVCGILILFFTLLGNYVLYLFGISISALRMGGGILLLAISLEMVGGLPRAKSLEIEEVAVVPLATPLLVGPGTITTLILLVTIYPFYLVIIVDGLIII